MPKQNKFSFFFFSVQTYCAYPQYSLRQGKLLFSDRDTQIMHTPSHYKTGHIPYTKTLTKFSEVSRWSPLHITSFYPFFLTCAVLMTAQCIILETPLVEMSFDLITCFLLYSQSVGGFIEMSAFSVFTQHCLFKGREKFVFVRTREASRNTVESVWPVSYVVSRVTVFLTAQYFKARFVWKCLHSTCTAVGLAVVAFIRLVCLFFWCTLVVKHSVCTTSLTSKPLLNPFGPNLFTTNNYKLWSHPTYSTCCCFKCLK